MDGKTKDALKQLQAEVRLLQAALSQAPASEAIETLAETKTAKKERAPVCAEYTVAAPEQNSDTKAAKGYHSAFTELQLDAVPDDAAAALGYALASAPKIGLLRALWHKQSEGAAALGEAAHLTTGSLYHHLRELMRADLVSQSGRNSYHLTARGARVLPMILALAASE